jgi:hypothetical protein
MAMRIYTKLESIRVLISVVKERSVTCDIRRVAT